MTQNVMKVGAEKLLEEMKTGGKPNSVKLTPSTVWENIAEMAILMLQSTSGKGHLKAYEQVRQMGKLLDSVSILHAPDVTAKPNRIIDAVLDQIQIDVAAGDVTAIEELIRHLPETTLKAFLTEDKFAPIHGAKNT